MTDDPDQPTTALEDSEDAVAVVCAHTFLDRQLNHYAFVFHIYGSRQRFTLHHTNPIRYRLGSTYRLTLTPTASCQHPPAQPTDPTAGNPADAA